MGSCSNPVAIFAFVGEENQPSQNIDTAADA
jgi:hypothetical protein